MTAQEVIKQFMASLDVQNYSTAKNALDDAIRKSSRFNGIQDALDNFLADQQKVERDSIQIILGDNYKEDYDGLQLSDLQEMAKTNTELAAALNESATYSDTPSNYGGYSFTAAQRIRMLTAETFLKDYCGIVLDYYIGYNTNGSTGRFNHATGNVDTGAITGSDAGGNTEKTASSIVPEIANKYTASTATRQMISTGDNDWIVIATDSADTITSGGADSINAGSGADVIYVEGNNATIKTGGADNYADTVTIRPTVTNVTVADLDEFDRIIIEGNFSLGSASLTDDTVTVTDSTGNRTLIINGWTTAKDAYISANNTNLKFGEWLSEFIDYEETESTNTAVISTDTSTPIIVNLSDVTSVGGSFNLSDGATEATFSADSNSGNVGTVSTEFPNVTSFTTHGVTVELWGNATNSEATTVTALTLDKMTNAQKTVFSGIYKWWIKEGLKLNEESYNLGFTTEGVTISNIKVFFYSDTSTTLAFVRPRTSNVELGINMRFFSSIADNNVDGTSGNFNLDRTLAHELTHAIMAANVNNYNSLPQFVKEGLAELTHGIDDERSTRIWDLAGGTTDTSRITTALNLSDTSTGDDDAYAGGYMFFRYFAKQAAIQTESLPVLGNTKVNVSLSGANETYYANFTSTVESATNTATDSNYSVGTAQNHNYTLAAGINQHIYTTDNGDWKFTNLGSNNSLTSGSGNDSVTLSSYDYDLYVNVGNGDNKVSINSSADNTIVAGSGADSVRIEYAISNTVQTGAGADSITFTNSNSSLNYIDAGAGEDYITIYGTYNTITGGADDDILVLRGNYNSIDGGAGNDDIEIYATENTILGGDGSDYIKIFSSNNYIDTGAGDDDIQVSATNNTVTGGAGADAFYIESGVRQLHITDFSVSSRDYIYLFYTVDYALYSSQSGAITLGDLSLYLDNANKISDFFNLRISLDGNNSVTLKSLLSANAFDWSNGEYYFLVDEGVVNIAEGELVYDKNKLQSGQNYAKVVISGSNITFESDVASTIELVPTKNTNYNITINNNTTYTFNGSAQIFNTPTAALPSTAYTGTYIISNGNTFFYSEDDEIKAVEYSGANDSSTVRLTIGEVPALYLNANDTVAMRSGVNTDYYIADSSSVIKKVGTATINTASDTAISEDIYTYQGGTFKFGNNVLDVDFSTELNHYTENYQSNTLTLWSGTLDLYGHTFKIQNTTADSGISFIYDDAGENLIGVNADNFTDGESLQIDDETYTVTNGKIIRSIDGEPYNGDWTEFIANMTEEYYWGAVTGWTIDSGSVIYVLDDEPVITINGLNLSGVEAIDGQIAEITLDNHTVNLAENLIGANQITVNGAGYAFNFNSTANVKVISAVTTITGSAEGDTINAEDIEHKNDDFYVRGDNGGDLIYVRNVKQSGGSFNILGEGNNDFVGVENVTVESGSSFNVSGNSGSDTISVSAVEIAGDGNFAVNGNDGDDFISANNLQNTTGYIGIFGNDGNDTISVTSINAANDSSYFISGDTYAESIGSTSNDSISVSNVTVSGGGVSVVGNSGDDTITVSNITVESGGFNVEGDYSGGTSEGDDLISISNANGIKIISGGGYDTLIFGGDVQGTISDFSANDTIQLNDSVKSGIFRNGVLKFGNVKVNLSGIEDIDTYAAMKVINGGVETTLGDLIAEGLTWEVEKGTAIYSENIITVTGLSTIATADDLDLADDDTVYVAEHALVPENTVEITRGYTLALADSVTVPETQEASWRVSDATAKYKTTTTPGYIVSNNTIIYQAEIQGADIITVNNLSSSATSSDLTVSGTTVTIAYNALNANKIASTPDGYTLALAEDVPVPTTLGESWLISNVYIIFCEMLTGFFRFLSN